MRHSRWTATNVIVEDLGSRNGVRVNGVRVDGTKELLHGDRLSIGTQEMVLVSSQNAHTRTVAQPEPTQTRTQAFGLLGSLAEKALALGRAEEAERILGSHLKQLLADASAEPGPPAELCERAALYALKLAGTSARAKWFDYVIQLYAELGAACPASVVDELYAVLPRLGQVDLAALRGYVASLRDRSRVGPAERFLVGRIEGLERIASVK